MNKIDLNYMCIMKIYIITMSINLRLVDFSVKNDKEDAFKIQMFGLNEAGETYSIIVK